MHTRTHRRHISAHSRRNVRAHIYVSCARVCAWTFTNFFCGKSYNLINLIFGLWIRIYLQNNTDVCLILNFNVLCIFSQYFPSKAFKCEYLLIGYGILMFIFLKIWKIHRKLRIKQTSVLFCKYLSNESSDLYEI